MAAEELATTAVHKAQRDKVENLVRIPKRALHLECDPAGDPQADNNIRAAWGALALDAYTNIVGRDDLDTSVADLLANLRHLCDALGVDFDIANHRAERYYDDEIHGVI